MRCFKEVIGYRMWFIWLVEDIERYKAIFSAPINKPQAIIGFGVTKEVTGRKQGKDELTKITMRINKGKRNSLFKEEQCAGSLW